MGYVKKSGVWSYTKKKKDLYNVQCLKSQKSDCLWGAEKELEYWTPRFMFHSFEVDSNNAARGCWELLLSSYLYNMS